MRHYKLNFRNRPLREQLVNCERHVDRIARLPAESRAQVDLPQVAGAVAAARVSFDHVQVLRSQLKSEVTRRNQLLRTARDATTYALGMAAVNANLQPAGLVAAGLELEAPKSPVGLPGAPGEFHAEPHENEGLVRLRWKRPIRRCTFMVQARADVETEWKNLETSVVTKCVSQGLTSGVKYWFRVCAVNAHGKGPWSNPVSVRVK